TLFAGRLGNDLLMLIAAVMLAATIPLIFWLRRLKVTELRNEDVRAGADELRIGGNPLAGFRAFFTDRRLLAIGAFILLYTMINTFVYFEQKNLLEVYDRETRTRILGGIDWATNILTFGLAFFATSRIVHWLGLGFTLALIPLLTAAGLLVLAFAPVVAVLAVLQAGRRAGGYAVTRPAREMLFTVVGREARFKAKPVIDVVVYRGGDSVTAWLFTALSQGLGLGLAALALAGAAVAGVWAALGFYLGHWFDSFRDTASAAPGSGAEAARSSS
ncbi:MAG TPA: hypothetical protein VK012_04440, partial [Gemmatimonadales bacterium]|nr:hypothetical protein [Gemmatimonadales bacterium]